ncbi:TPA: hypothetical protein PEG73_000275 [Staphylococcus aureus]|nr:hypothetical protein [Staphylococcus aureus]
MPFLYFTTAWFSSPILRGSYRSINGKKKETQEKVLVPYSSG